MGDGGQDARNRDRDAGEKSRTGQWLSVSTADLGFIVCVAVISGAVGVAFENALGAGLLAVFGGMVGWAVWKEFQYRALHRKGRDK